MNPDISQLGHIGILMGGCSSEREISLRSGEAVYTALKERGCQVTKIDISTDDEEAILRLLKESLIQVAFITLHGRLGEDGRIQAILEKVGLPYTGSGVEASQRSLNKILTQDLLMKKQIPVPEYKVVRQEDHCSGDLLFEQFNGSPFVVKPASEGSSIGITIVRKKEETQPALALAFKYGEEVLVERFISGRELTVGILGQEALPVIEIKPKEAFFDFHAKYQAGTTEYLIPAPISQDMAARIQTIALQAHRALGCRHLSRVDVILDEQHQPFVLEINTIPGFTKTSLLPKAAAARGISFPDLCLKLTRLAYETKK